MLSPIPRSALFAFSVPIYQAGHIVVDGDLAEWTERYRLPALSLEGRPPFADLWAAWSPDGLWFALYVPRTKTPRVLPNRLSESDCLELYVDTRDVRTAHRAGRYCHKFVVAPVGGPGRARRPLFVHQEIARATASPPPVGIEQIEIASEVAEDHYAMELFLPATALFGYDVEVTRRMGLAYVLHDVEHYLQVWPHSEALPVQIDPSLWATIELTA